MNNQIVTVNLIPGLSTPAVVRVSQYDVGRPITFNILDGASAASISPSMTVTVVGTKPSGLGFSQSAVIASLSTVTINTTLAMTQECGMIPAEIRFTQSGANVGTANFILAIEPSPHPEGTTDGTQETMADLETRLQGEIDSLDSRVDALEAGQGGGSGLTDDVKNALLNCFAHVAWVDADGQDYYDALESALDSGDLSVSLTLSQVSSSNTATTVGYGESYTTTLTASTGYTLNTVSVTMGGVDITSTAYSSGTVSIPSVTGNIVITATAVLAAQSITATYTQSGTVYDTDSLDSLKADLVVTANYSGGTSETVPASDYTLSGTLTVGTSTITVSYAGLTDTFDVTVSVAGTSFLTPATAWNTGSALTVTSSSADGFSGTVTAKGWNAWRFGGSMSNPLFVPTSAVDGKTIHISFDCEITGYSSGDGIVMGFASWVATNPTAGSSRSKSYDALKKTTSGHYEATVTVAESGIDIASNKYLGLYVYCNMDASATVSITNIVGEYY